jgi:ABC-type transporter Mla MlaB component
MTAQPPREITCDAGALAADATAVAALARLQLGAKRQGSRIRLTGTPADLAQLLAFCGLSELFEPDPEPSPLPDA